MFQRTVAKKRHLEHCNTLRRLGGVDNLDSLQDEKNAGSALELYSSINEWIEDPIKSAYDRLDAINARKVLIPLDDNSARLVLMFPSHNQVLAEALLTVIRDNFVTTVAALNEADDLEFESDLTRSPVAPNADSTATAFALLGVTPAMQMEELKSASQTEGYRQEFKSTASVSISASAPTSDDAVDELPTVALAINTGDANADNDAPLGPIARLTRLGGYQ